MRQSNVSCKMLHVAALWSCSHMDSAASIVPTETRNLR